MNASLASAAPEVQSGLDRLSLWLAAEGYGLEPIARILAHVAGEGTLAGSIDLDPGDEEWAEWSFVEGLEACAATSPRWDEGGHWTGCGPVYLPTGTDLVLDYLVHYLTYRLDYSWTTDLDGGDRLDRRLAELADEWEPFHPGPEPPADPWAEMMAAGSPPPVSGGAPYEPTASDWAEYSATFDADDDPTMPRPWRSARELEEWTRRALES